MASAPKASLLSDACPIYEKITAASLQGSIEVSSLSELENFLRHSNICLRVQHEFDDFGELVRKS